MDLLLLSSTYNYLPIIVSVCQLLKPSTNSWEPQTARDEIVTVGGPLQMSTNL